MDQKMARLATAAILATLAVPAGAQTEAACEAAIVAVQRALLDVPALENAPEERRERIQRILVEAAEAGTRGDYGTCIEKVDVARGIAGLSAAGPASPSHNRSG